MFGTRFADPALEAAHVCPYARGGEHALANGLLLRADIHRLHDSGYVTVTPDHRFRVSGDLYGADDDRSMAADNTSACNGRRVSGAPDG